ncbi:MAG: 4Fe-4S dicluster domain-containing protein [Candidatus Omnitrophica bacterium]|nr:4Fe-4S dicluster domain-containing protein [Candidatus Omnitrophota bacterium]
MRKPKLRELREAIKALIKGPYTAGFPFEAHTPFEKFRGKPYFHEEDCIGCGACSQVCPARAIEFEDKIIDGKAKRVLTLRLDRCIFCGQCQSNCPTEKGIILSGEFDLATTDKREDLKQEIEKEIIACECCNELIVPRDQYEWVAKRLGPLSFSNASLLLFYLRDLDLALKEIPHPSQKESDSLRSERIKILCPRCRREAVTKS